MQTHLILKKYFKKHRFSIRSVATHLDLSASFLIRVLAGKKPIPYPLLLKLIKTLDIEAETAAQLKSAHLVEVESEAAPKRGKAEAKTAMESWQMAERSDFSVLRQWFYVAILDTTMLENFDGKTKTLSERLGISLVTTEIAVRELLDKGLLEIVNGKIQKSQRRIRWGSPQNIQDIRNFHAQMLEKAIVELKQKTDEEDFSRRLITGITVTASQKKIEAAKKKLSECIHEIANELMEDDGDQVYHLATQLFPLTKK